MTGIIIHINKGICYSCGKMSRCKKTKSPDDSCSDWEYWKEKEASG